MQIAFSNNPVPDVSGKDSVFLAGPTPRDKDTPSWRPAVIEIFKNYDFDGCIFVPEWDWSLGEMQCDYNTQIEWELEALEKADVIGFWVPRDLKKMPAFTTNVEFGLYLKSNKIVYGRPNDAPKMRYLDKLYKDWYMEKPKTTIETFVESIIYGRLLSKNLEKFRKG